MKENFLELMRTYRPQSWDEERPVVDELVNFVRENNTCFERQHIDGAIHITASVMLISHDMERCLLQLHKKIGRWLQFGGHMDGNPDAMHTALQELKEESGITDVSVYRNGPYDVARFDFLDPAVFGYRKTMYDVRFLAIAGEDVEAANKEPEKAAELRWCTPAEAMALADDNYWMKRLILKWDKIRQASQYSAYEGQPDDVFFSKSLESDLNTSHH